MAVRADCVSACLIGQGRFSRGVDGEQEAKTILWNRRVPRLAVVCSTDSAEVEAARVGHHPSLPAAFVKADRTDAEASRESASAMVLSLLRLMLSFGFLTCCFVSLVIEALAPAPARAQQFTPPLWVNSTATTDSQDDGAPCLASDGKGVVVAVWESLNKPKAAVAWYDWDIFVARSADGGASWSKAAAIAGYAASDTGADNNPVVATDGRGNWVAAWQSLGTVDGRLGPDSDILFVRSADNAKTWSRAAALASYAATDIGQDFNPALLALPDGTWIAAWETSEAIADKGSNFDIVFSRSHDAGATWSAPLPLSRNAATDRDTDRQVVLATDGKGVVLATWEAFAAEGGKLGTDWDIMLARSENAGATWSEPVPLASTAATDGLAADTGVSLATDGSGRWVAVWASSAIAQRGGNEDGQDILRVVSTDGGKTWSAPAVLKHSLAGEVEREQTPRIVYDRNGRWVAVWHSKDGQKGGAGNDGDIVFSTSTDGGEAWTSSKPPVEDAKDVGSSRGDKPFALLSGNGSVLVAWSSRCDLAGKTGTDADIKLVRGVRQPLPAAASASSNAPVAAVVDDAQHDER